MCIGWADDATDGIMAMHFLHHFCQLSIANANFSVLTKCWVPMFLSKLSKNCAFLGNG